ncbi:MAG: PD40 domain-containing protein, partial [Proteobacteria bacterium]|nr:PD40 domain-containing protein [Pseudomonadota bacterium]
IFQYLSFDYIYQPMLKYWPFGTILLRGGKVGAFNTAADMWPSISADGSKIAFHSNVDGEQSIFVVSYVFIWK